MHDVGEGTSKGNSAIVHTGFDAPVGTLEARLVTRASRRWPELARELRIPFEECGALLAALDGHQEARLEAIRDKALANGVDDVRLVSRQEARMLDPSLSREVRRGLLVPREALVDPFTTCVAFAEVALANGTDIVLGAEVVGLEKEAGHAKCLHTRSGHRFEARVLVNAAGLGGRRLAVLHGGAPFEINPRRGQFLIFDKHSRSLVRRILLPVPTARTKGVLTIPTIFGNLLAGPTAEDLPPGSPEITDTTSEGLAALLSEASLLCPALSGQPVIGAYAGARCNCAQGSYLIRHDDGWPGVTTVTGIRSTGLSSSFELARHVAGGLEHCGLALEPDPAAVTGRPEEAWPGWWRRPGDGQGSFADLHRIVCSCENVSRGEITRALDSPLRPRTLDAVKRRTRVLTGRCQGFECRVGVAELISEHCGIPIDRVTRRGPGTELVARAGGAARG